MAAHTIKPPAFGHTRIKEDWHVLYTGTEAWFGSSREEVLAKARNHAAKNNHNNIADTFQAEALSFTDNQTGVRTPALGETA